MPCLDCGRPGVRGRCTLCTRGRDRARGSRQVRGYGAEHEQLRADWQRRMDDGEVVTCATCPTVLNGQAWDLGHVRGDRTRYRGPQCLPCNRGHRAG
jgi:hypothetical protein